MVALACDESLIGRLSNAQTLQHTAYGHDGLNAQRAKDRRYVFSCAAYRRLSFRAGPSTMRVLNVAGFESPRAYLPDC